MKPSTAFKGLVIALMCLGALVPAALAQNEEPPATTPIQYGSRVEGALTVSAFWDWWQLDAHAGDRMVVEMTGADGLAPLLGILDSNGTLIDRSVDGDPNGVVDMLFTAPSSGRYTIVTTRAGNANGTTVGTYVLRLGLDNAAPRPTPSAEVVFRCGPSEATSVISLRFIPNQKTQTDTPHQIAVVGLDGFQPVVRVAADGSEAEPDCLTAVPVTGDTAVTLADRSAVPSGAVIARGAIPASTSRSAIVVTIGSADHAAGRYLAVVDGFMIEPSNLKLAFDVRQGPRAAQNSDALVYMIAADGSRLDPSVYFADESVRCDDAGRRDCAAVPAVTGAGIVSGDGLRVTGHRFDAGLRIPQGSPDPRVVVMNSFEARTSGGFSLLVLGALRP